MTALTFCIADDRALEEAGMRLALLSLRRHHPEADVFLYRPRPTPSFCEWLQGFPKVTLISQWPGTGGWNCKPKALLEMLDRGVKQVIWLDSDILLTRPCGDLFADLNDRTLVVAQEPVVSPHQGTALRTEGWHLRVGRALPTTLNSCVLRITEAHRPLLVRWNELLAQPDYVAAQKLPLVERPIHFFGDQDALNALLGSTEFADVPVHKLRLGRDVAHTGGARTYSLGERLGGLFRPAPIFLHNQWAKPWVELNPAQKSPGRFWMFHRITLETSPYMTLARGYESEMGGDTAWLRFASPLGLVVRALGFGNVALSGLPLTVAASVIAAIKGR
jgi:hypothetical protein